MLNGKISVSTRSSPNLIQTIYVQWLKVCTNLLERALKYVTYQMLFFLSKLMRKYFYTYLSREGYF